MQLPAPVTKKAAGAGALPCNIRGLATLRYDRARAAASVAASLLFLLQLVFMFSHLSFLFTSPFVLYLARLHCFFNLPGCLHAFLFIVFFSLFIYISIRPFISYASRFFPPTHARTHTRRTFDTATCTTLSVCGSVDDHHRG